MKRIQLIVVLCFVFLLVSSMAWVRINLMQPALIVLPQHIKNVAIIDRTLQSEDTRNKVEQVLTGEIMKQDEQAIRQASIGIINTCLDFELYNIQQTTERFIGGGTKTTFPVPMNWKEVERLCEKYQCDALLTIEIFDSDFILTNPVNIVKQVAEGTSGGYNVTGIAIVNFGVRVYDPLNKKIADEYKISHKMDYNLGGSSVHDAVKQVLDKVEAIKQVSYDAGRLYGERISPTYYTVTREFYSKPKKNSDLRAGVRKSEVADWNGAIESWTKALNAKPKIAGRAAFNIAVAYEVLGDLEKAKEWARKAYIDYEEKMANDYYNILVNRIREEEIIKRQVPVE